MSLFRTILIASVSISLLSCSNGDEDKYNGPPKLTNSQSLKAATAITNMDKLERAIDEISYPDEKETDQDILDLVELIKDCDVFQKAEIVNDLLEITSRVGDKENNPECPVFYTEFGRYSFIEEGEEIKATSGFVEVEFSALSQQVIDLIDIKSFSYRIDMTLNGLYKLSAKGNSATLGQVSITDRTAIRSLGNNIEELTFYRRMVLGGFVVEARFILKYDSKTGEPKELQLLVNGQSVSAEEFYALYPNPFDQFDDGKRMNRELPRIPKP